MFGKFECVLKMTNEGKRFIIHLPEFKQNGKKEDPREFVSAKDDKWVKEQLHNSSTDC